MTELDVTDRSLLPLVARRLSETESAADIYENVCTAALKAGFSYARFELISAEPVARGTEPADESIVRESVEIQTDETAYGTLTLVPPTDHDTDLDAVADLVAFGLERYAASSRRQTLIEDQARKVQKLHSIAARMAECTSEIEIFHLGMDAAENILEFDISSLDTVEDGVIEPRVLSTGMPDDDSLRLKADEGIAGETYQETRTIIVDDLREHPKGNPENPEFRALLSVPIEDRGVFQAGAREVGAFDETDAELAELLMTHVSQSLNRLDSAAQLRESEEKYRTLVERSHDAVVIYQDGALVFANARADELVDRDHEELLGTSPSEFVHPDDEGVVDDVLAELDESPDDHATYEIRLLRQDGTHRHCECSASSISYQGDHAVLVSVRDITDRKHRQRELERKNEQLEEFASVLSHDLRNPLNVARGSVDLAERTGEERHFERAEEAFDRMEDLIEGILELARQGRLVDETEEVALQSVAERSWRSIDSPNASLDLAVDDVSVDADPMRLQELLENLFRNAIEHAGDDVSVTVSPLPGGDGFCVTDDGPGIPVESADQVFEYGFTSSADGTGFGLAIVESIAEAHGWDVRVGEADGASFEVHGVSMF